MSKKNLLFVFLLILVLTLNGCDNNNENKSENDSSDLNENEKNELTIVDGSSDNESLEVLEDVVEEDVAEEDVAEEEVVMLEFISEKYNFSLMYPSNWIIVDKDSYGVLLRPSTETQTSFYVDVHTTVYADYTYDDFIDEMVGDIMRIRSEANFSELESIQINNYPFVKLDYNGLSPDGTRYYYESYYTATDKGYEMYYVASEEVFELQQETMEKIALSFKFLE